MYTLKRMMVHMLLDQYLIAEKVLIYIAYKLFDVLRVPLNLISKKKNLYQMNINELNTKIYTDRKQNLHLPFANQYTK